ncbi:MAG: hypothetical protein NC548_05500 [Lachnospiraceae bacterium]|nr:hypothetical protein [Lachnospiraceae bacterium]
MKLGNIHWSVPEDSVPWNPAYFMHRVAEVLTKEKKPFDFIGTLNTNLVMVGNHERLDSCIGYIMQAYYYDGLNAALYPVCSPIIFDGTWTTGIEPSFDPKEYLTVFLSSSDSSNDITRHYRRFVAHAWTLDTYFPIGGS